jgi:hypothetical protein
MQNQARSLSHQSPLCSFGWQRRTLPVWMHQTTRSPCRRGRQITVADFGAVKVAICLGGVRNFARQQFPRNSCHTIL